MSHHSMSTAFSGTDTETLRELGSRRTHFLSLIVNHAKTYSAALTTKVEKEMLVKKTFETFNGSPIVKEYIVKKQCVEYYPLTVKLPTVKINEELDNRIQEILEKQKQDAQSNMFPMSALNCPEFRGYSTSGGLRTYMGTASYPNTDTFWKDGEKIVIGEEERNTGKLSERAKAAIAKLLVADNLIEEDVDLFIENQLNIVPTLFTNFTSFVEYADGLIEEVIMSLDKADIYDIVSIFENYSTSRYINYYCEELYKYIS